MPFIIFKAFLDIRLLLLCNFPPVDLTQVLHPLAELHLHLLLHLEDGVCLARHQVGQSDLVLINLLTVLCSQPVNKYNKE